MITIKTLSGNLVEISLPNPPTYEKVDEEIRTAMNLSKYTTFSLSILDIPNIPNIPNIPDEKYEDDKDNDEKIQFVDGGFYLIYFYTIREMVQKIIEDYKKASMTGNITQILRNVRPYDPDSLESEIDWYTYEGVEKMLTVFEKNSFPLLRKRYSHLEIPPVSMKNHHNLDQLFKAMWDIFSEKVWKYILHLLQLGEEYYEEDNQENQLIEDFLTFYHQTRVVQERIDRYIKF